MHNLGVQFLYPSTE